jgi:hypothetical protein
LALGVVLAVALVSASLVFGLGIPAHKVLIGSAVMVLLGVEFGSSVSPSPPRPAGGGCRPGWSVEWRSLATCSMWPRNSSRDSNRRQRGTPWVRPSRSLPLAPACRCHTPGWC